MKKTEIPTAPTGFGALGDALRSAGLPELPAGAPPRPETAPSPEKRPKSRPKPVLSVERKGRGGKTVTLVARLGLQGEALEEMARRIRQKLGCGAMIEGEVVVVQGDQRERLEAALPSLMGP